MKGATIERQTNSKTKNRNIKTEMHQPLNLKPMDWFFCGVTLGLFLCNVCFVEHKAEAVIIA